MSFVKDVTKSVICLKVKAVTRILLTTTGASPAGSDMWVFVLQSHKHPG